ncbi:hypothetical protein ACJX0J_007124 [Zea mays]
MVEKFIFWIIIMCLYFRSLVILLGLILMGCIAFMVLLFMLIFFIWLSSHEPMVADRSVIRAMDVVSNAPIALFDVLTGLSDIWWGGSNDKILDEIKLGMGITLTRLQVKV